MQLTIHQPNNAYESAQQQILFQPLSGPKEMEIKIQPYSSFHINFAKIKFHPQLEYEFFSQLSQKEQSSSTNFVLKCEKDK